MSSAGRQHEGHVVYRFDRATLAALVTWVGEQAAEDIERYREQLETARRKGSVLDQLAQAEARLAVLQKAVRYMHVRSDRGLLALETVQLLAWGYRRRPGYLPEWRPYGHDD